MAATHCVIEYLGHDEWSLRAWDRDGLLSWSPPEISIEKGDDDKRIARYESKANLRSQNEECVIY